MTCINAVGDDAVIGGEVERVMAGTPGGEYVLVFIYDGEEPGAGSDQVSRTFNSTPLTCTETATGLTPITQGNYVVVHDGTS